MALPKLFHRPDRPSLRERLSTAAAGLADARKRAVTAAKVARVVAAPPAPKPKPVDRVALVSYATWLFMERRLVCMELYPQAGPHAESLIASAPAAHDFHFPPGGRWQDVPQPSTRAVRILDMLGVDWRSAVAREATFDPEMRAATEGSPHSWPAVDAALLEALDDLTRLDAAQRAMGAVDDDRDVGDVPGYGALEDARSGALDRLAELRAESLIGLQAKARALLTRSVVDMGGAEYEAVAEGLARDLLGASHRHIRPTADPALAVIAEGRRLLKAARDSFALPDIGIDPNPEKEAAQVAAWGHFRGPLLSTIPTTARGCADLARYATEFQAFQQVDLDAELLAILALIARSPLL